MPLTKADYDTMLKIDYQGPMVDQLENATYLLSRMERYTEPTGGKQFYIPLRTGRTTSIGARNDSNNKTLPTGDRPTYGSATFTAKSLYATARITGVTMRASNVSSLAFANALTSDMELTANDMKKDLNRQLFGDGSGELCRVSGISGSATVTVTSALYPTLPNKFLYVREKVDVRTVTTLVAATGGATGDSLSITAVPRAGTTFDYSGSAFTNTANTLAVYREDNVTPTGSASSSTEIEEIFGLTAALYNVNPSSASIPGGTTSFGTRLTDNYGGINRSTAGNEYWQGNVLTNTTAGTLRPFSVNLVMQGIDTAEIIGGGKVSVIQTNHAIYRQYGAILAANKQFEGAQMKLDGGWDALNVSGIPMVKDHECPDYHVFCIDETTLKLGVIGEWAWIDNGNGPLTRLTGYDEYEAVMNRDCQLICDAPNKSCVIADIAHS